MFKILHPVLLLVACVMVSRSEAAPQLVHVTSVPQLDQHEQGPFLTVRDVQHCYYLILPSFPFLLDTNRTYSFTVIDDPSRTVFIEDPFNGVFGATLARVQLDGKTIYDIEVCEVHKVKMNEKDVPIIYGLYRPGPEVPSPDIERRFFPHRREYALGGCMRALHGPTKEKRYLCGQCKVAYEKWAKDNTRGKK
jgi:hypothetical protein